MSEINSNQNRGASVGESFRTLARPWVAALNLDSRATLQVQFRADQFAFKKPGGMGEVEGGKEEDHAFGQPGNIADGEVMARFDLGRWVTWRQAEVHLCGELIQILRALVKRHFAIRQIIPNAIGHGR